MTRTTSAAGADSNLRLVVPPRAGALTAMGGGATTRSVPRISIGSLPVSPSAAAAAGAGGALAGAGATTTGDAAATWAAGAWAGPASVAAQDASRPAQASTRGKGVKRGMGFGVDGVAKTGRGLRRSVRRAGGAGGRLGRAAAETAALGGTGRRAGGRGRIGGGGVTLATGHQGATDQQHERNEGAKQAHGSTKR